MNLKGTMVSIVTAMLVMPLFASSAMAAIIVDGDPSDWDPDDKLCGDEDVPLLTLPGLLALIGTMCIVGAGRILTKGRRS